MKVIGIAGSVVGSKTRIAVEQVLTALNHTYETAETELIDLGDYELVFSDGRDYRDYTGDTKVVLEKIMAADAFIIGTPIFQASIPGTLKNLFDLLPNEAFKGKLVGILATAGSPKHYLVPEHQLKPVLSYMKAVILPKYVFVEETHFAQKTIVDEEAKSRLNQLAADLMHGVQVFSEVQKARDSAFPF
ncbi:NAD(P)H-dependent oxidoreductase [Barrientosiimonas marina]|uniref:NADPH-dependent FMN reductase n=1 Tax=Lentibacillus kimchii TaxID=1542911 RepID=A0ABW2UUK9_9BACI